MKPIRLLITYLFLCTTAISASESTLREVPSRCDASWLTTHLEHRLPCYLLKEEPESGWKIIRNTFQVVNVDGQDRDVSILHADLSSLSWEPDPQYAPDSPLWQHRLTIYKPETVISDRALLVINGGISHPRTKGQQHHQGDIIDFARIAARTQSIVIDLKDIPNQYLKFPHSSHLREDNLVSFSWGQFLVKPEPDSSWPLHMPMAKAVIAAMDAIEAILAIHDITINGFVLEGGSKRGWTASLTASQDKRVTAIIPMVADFLNLGETIKHLLNVYPEGNPAVSAYLHLPLRDTSSESEMQQLIAMIDPFQYRDALSIPKYIVSASGDEFTPPDNSKLSFGELPGKKWMRVLPNQGHYIVRDNEDLVTDITESFYGAIVEGRVLPDIEWDLQGHQLTLTSSQAPKAAWLWQATNATDRDFRRIPSIENLSDFRRSPIHMICQQNACKSSTDIPEPDTGWSASFIELHFDNAPYADLVFTTRVFVQPDRYPTSSSR
ncbi:PhoPQ-activated protein PqaA family protein [uncultured Endozoicomonas sp.]|uniref:PhoPQ-activated protein PqaA family protein n=1 Tax=uncultured Endozoicomonas sp. TaxID=432652 RepID=UPI00261EA44A|nr:PhoPQ-activated protein PqaA family protein [uncultured Endozoicomonas sp.]